VLLLIVPLGICCGGEKERTVVCLIAPVARCQKSTSECTEREIKMRR
jgi:hypothetical protein